MTTELAKQKIRCNVIHLCAFYGAIRVPKEYISVVETDFCHVAVLPLMKAHAHIACCRVLAHVTVHRILLCRDVPQIGRTAVGLIPVNVINRMWGLSIIQAQAMQF